MRSKLLVVIISLLISTITGCGSEKDIDREMYKIGIVQYEDSTGFNHSAEGFKNYIETQAAGEDTSISIELEIANADESEVNRITTEYINAKVDLIVAVGSQAAQGAYSIAQGEGIPVIYVAVTDPLKLGLTTNDGMPIGEVSGTSVGGYTQQHLMTIEEVLPNIEVLGVLYDAASQASQVEVDEYKNLAKEVDLEIKEWSIQNNSDGSDNLDQWLKEVNGIMILDNGDGIHAIIEKANHEAIPVFTNKIELLELGCLMAKTVNYFELGSQAALMAVKVLKGEIYLSEVSHVESQEFELTINNKVAANLGIILSPAIRERVGIMMESAEFDY